MWPILITILTSKILLQFINKYAYYWVVINKYPLVGGQIKKQTLTTMTLQNGEKAKF